MRQLFVLASSEHFKVSAAALIFLYAEIRVHT
jgi:hypothetical protein